MHRTTIKDRRWWTEKIGAIHIQGEFALNSGETTKWTWDFGELWPRAQEHGSDTEKN